MREHQRLHLPRLERVYLTHHHSDNCAGLSQRETWPFAIHAPAGEEKFLLPDWVGRFHEPGCKPVPASYDVLPHGLLCPVQFDLRGFTDQRWNHQRLRFLATPGHGPNAISILLDHAGKQVVFCGDAAHAEATIWQPFHLEWDHWTSSGALAACEGVRRLASLKIDMLCPSHGGVVRNKPRAMLARLSRRLRNLVEVKGSICAGEPDRYVSEELLEPDVRRLAPNLFSFGTNGYLLVSTTNQALVIDPYSGDKASLEKLLARLPGVKPTAAVATHYHMDHIDGAPQLRERFGTRLFLHPRIAEILRDTRRKVPWRPVESIRHDGTLPRQGSWKWQEYTFDVAPFAGQTWWHCCLMTRVAGQKVLFTGDNFQPASRWNGTGGFCALNGSRFREGFAASAQLALAWRPDILCNGHGTWMRFAPSYFRKVIRWSRRAEATVKALCPKGDLEGHYHQCNR